MFSRYRTLRGQELLVITFLEAKETYLFCLAPVINYTPVVDYEHWRNPPDRTIRRDRLMRRKTKRRKRYRGPRLTIARILDLADDYHAEHGRWPKYYSDPIPGELDFNWRRIDNALRYGLRGLAGGSSLARLLAEHRGVRTRSNLPELTPEQIRVWALAYRQRTGKWPTALSGPVEEAPGETWKGIEMALVQGHRGLPKGLSIARVLKPLKEKSR